MKELLRKRALAALLACALAILPAMAEELIEVPEDAVPKAVISEDQMERVDIADEATDGLRAGDVKGADLSGLSIPATQDQVSVAEDGTLTVVTDGVSVSVLAPFGTTAFGQDVVAQLDVYSMFTDPGAIVGYMQSLGAHICVLDLAAGTQMFVLTGNDVTMSAIVNDIDMVSPDVLEMLVQSLQKYDPTVELSVRTCGENTFVVYDYRKSNQQMIVYTSVKNNTNIDFVLSPGGDAITDTEISTMEYLLSDAELKAA